MLLKNIFMMALLVVSAGVAQAQPIPLLEAGRYELAEGDKELCPGELTFSEKAVRRQFLAVGGLYRYEVKNSQSILESDLDPKCEFREQTRSELNTAGESKLVRVNEEVCSGKTTSRITSTAVVTKLKVQLTHEIEGVTPYTCVWKKADL